MATIDELNQSIVQAVSDFDGIEEAIVECGVEVPHGTDTSEYGDKVRAVYSRGYTEGRNTNLEIDSELSETSENPVQNKVITATVKEIQNSIPVGDEKSITIEDELIKLAGFDTAKNGTLPRKRYDGTMEWALGEITDKITNTEIEDILNG